MVAKSSSERMIDALGRALQHWKRDISSSQVGQTKAPSPTKVFTITISRQSGTQGSLIAQKVAEKLKWTVYNRELLHKIAQEKDLTISLLEGVDEKHKSWLQDCIEAFSLGPSISEEAYVKYLEATLHSLSSLGNCILVGRGSAHILPPDKTLRIRLVGPLKNRVANAEKLHGISNKEATKLVNKTDYERCQFVQSHFNCDPCDPSNYDLVINTCRYSVDMAAELIVQGLRCLQEGQK